MRLRCLSTFLVISSSFVGTADAGIFRSRRCGAPSSCRPAPSCANDSCSSSACGCGSCGKVTPCSCSVGCCASAEDAGTTEPETGPVSTVRLSPAKRFSLIQKGNDFYGFNEETGQLYKLDGEQWTSVSDAIVGTK
jgi:hypothetical protein